MSVASVGIELWAVMETPKHVAEFQRETLGKHSDMPNSICCAGIFRAGTKSSLARTHWTFLTKKGRAVPLASQSYLCAPDFRC